MLSSAAGSPPFPPVRINLSLPSTSLSRADTGSEDWNSEKGRSAVFHEDVHGLKKIVHLPDEVILGIVLG